MCAVTLPGTVIPDGTLRASRACEDRPTSRVRGAQSPERHATVHANAGDHPIIRSLQRDQERSRCDIDRIAMLTPR
jgi:hypothetical protein